MSCISSRVKVQKIQRQGLDIANIVDSSKHVCVKFHFFILVAICMNLKPFVFWDFSFVFLLHYNKAKLFSTDTLADLSLR